MQSDIKLAQEYIENADAILITTGAGMGVDSGLPDFRGDSGFWKAYPVIKELGYSFAQMANPQWFQTNPKLAWAFYGHRYNLYKQTQPHKGFEMLLELVKQKNENYFIFTSNVDGQFQKAGFDKTKIVEVHGTIFHFQCLQNCTQEIWEAQEQSIDVDMATFQANKLPHCKNCEALARPNILMFNDWGWYEQRTDKQEIQMRKWLKEQTQQQKQIAIIELGAGTTISTVRIKGENLVKRYNKAKLIRINPREFEVEKDVGYSIAFGAMDGLKQILKKGKI